MQNFSDFGLAAPILRALDQEGHKTPTPIQASAIPPLLKGRDVLGLAQTGSGKTAAFVLPALQSLLNAATHRRLPRACRVLVLAPTRELAAQVLERFTAYGAGQSVRAALAIGGVSIGKQKSALAKGVDVLVATPGRLQDLHRQGAVDFGDVAMLVLDEVDQMLDLGFLPAIRAITRELPAARQNVFFSATMPPRIEKLAAELLRDPVKVAIETQRKPQIDQSVVFLTQNQKGGALLDVLARNDFSRGLVFTRTKRGADKVVRALNQAGAEAFAIHGNRSQGQRERALSAFRDGRARVLVATDIAARGIDVADVSHVVNYDVPNVPETYVHRIGRTARAGASGVAVSFCTAEERGHLRAIEKLTGARLAATHLGGAPATEAKQAAEARPAARRQDDKGKKPSRPKRRRYRTAQRRKPTGEARASA